MIFSEYMGLVLENMGEDADRSPSQTLRNRSIFNAMIDLQRYIRPLREAHMDTLEAGDLDEDGSAMSGTLPAGAIPKAFFIYLEGDAENCKRYRLDQVDWESRQAMICECLPADRYVYAISPSNRTYYIHPALTEDTRLLVMWEGFKQSWNQDDVMMPGWDSITAEAVGEFAKSRVIRDYDKTDAYAGIRRSDNHFKSYVTRRRDIFLDYKEGQFSGMGENVIAPEMLIPVSRAVLSLSSLDELRALTTAGGAIVLDTLLSVVTDGMLSQWRLEAGTNADDSDVWVRPADFNETTNPRVFHRVTANIQP